ncbi:MAG: hypothetical protein ACXABD_01335 [Candidatus Thorarchaeota archaeon]
MPDFNCECSNNCNVVSPCRGCSECGWADWWDTGADGCKVYNQKRLDQRQKVIQKVVRVDSSQYSMNKAAMSVYQRKPRTAFGLRFGSMYNYPSTMSDRREPHVVTATQAVYRHTSSKHGSKTALRPGALSANGVGVDVKHGSYERYLLRKKGISLKAGNGAYENRDKRSPTYEEIVENPSLTTGGKNVKFSIISGGGDCECEPNCVAFTNDDPAQAGEVNTFNVAVCDDTWDDVGGNYTAGHHSVIIQNNNARNGYFAVVNDTRYGLIMYKFENSSDRETFLNNIHSNIQVLSFSNYAYYWKPRLNSEHAIKLSAVPSVKPSPLATTGYAYPELVNAVDLLKALTFGGQLFNHQWPNS